jgi:diguanylate cyclase (GGDEF)-like protein
VQFETTMRRLGRIITAFNADPTASAREMGRRGALLYGAGCVVVLVSLLLPHPGADAQVILGVAIAAGAVASGLWVWGDWVPVAIYPAFTATGTVLITVLVRFGGSVGDGYAPLYVWAALFAFYFYRRPAAILQMSLIGVAMGLMHPGISEVDRLITFVTVAVAGFWVSLAVDQVRVLARTDPLTGIPNRRAWEDELPRTMARAQREGTPLCIAMLDLDHFKVFNDEQGHQAGDLLLQHVVPTWRTALRAGDVLARYGGEEFAILLPQCALADGMTAIERLRRRVPQGVTCSAGVAMWDGSEGAATLMARADAALYEAKGKGRNRSVAALPSLDGGEGGVLTTATRWASTVLTVLSQGTIEVAYQPVVRLVDHGVVGYEALARPPGVARPQSVDGLFVAAQRLGRVRELDHVCRRAALEHARVLPAETLLFLNVSVAALLDPHHDADQMILLTDSVGREPRSVVLEISERETVSNLDRLCEVVAAYRNLGFRFAIDDVGEGHSTLEVLAAALPEFVKIAGRFTRHLHETGPRAAIEATCLFAGRTGATVIAEGIEDEATVQVLRSLSVELGQGFHLGRPGPLPSQQQLTGAALHPVA